MTVMLICGYSNWVTKPKCSSLADYTSNFKNLTIFSLTRDRETLRLCSHFGHNWSTVRSPSTSSRPGARTRNWAPCVRMFSVKFSGNPLHCKPKTPCYAHVSKWKSTAWNIEQKCTRLHIEYCMCKHNRILWKQALKNTLCRGRSCYARNNGKSLVPSGLGPAKRYVNK